MKIFLVRHGQDDSSVRGGWSNSPLTDAGVRESVDLANEICRNAEYYNIGRIFSSDIVRAEQTANIIAEKLGLTVEFTPQFREVNNGELAGLKNSVADEKYPNLYWRKLAWEEHYPGGESPKEFYGRVSSAWQDFTQSLVGYGKNALLITHGGVINVIRCISQGTEYSNTHKYPSVSSAKIALELEF